MGDVVAVAAEEDQVAGQELAVAYLDTIFILLLSSAGEAVAKVLVAIQDEAGAVEAVGTVSTVNIGIALVALSKGQQVFDHSGLYEVLSVGMLLLPADSKVVATEEHGEGFLNRGVVLGRQLLSVAHNGTDIDQQAGRGLCPICNIGTVTVFQQGNRTAVLTGVADDLHEVGHDLEELFSSQRVGGTEAAFAVAGYDTQLIGGTHICRLCIRKMVCPLCGIGDLGCGGIGQHCNGAHLLTGNSSGHVAIVQAGGDHVLLLHGHDGTDGPIGNAGIALRLDLYLLALLCLGIEPLAHILIGTEEHNDCFLTAGMVLGVQLAVGALYDADGNHDLRRLNGIVADGGAVLKAVQGLQLRLRIAVGRSHEVVGDLEELLTGQRIVGTEFAVAVAGDNTLLIGIADIRILGVLKMVGRVRIGVATGQMLKDEDSHLAHFASGDLAGHVCVTQALGQEAQLIHRVYGI